MSFSEDIKKPFNIITLTIAIISIGLTIYFYVEGIKEKSICYKIEHNPSLIFDNEKISPNIRVLEKDSIIIAENIYMIKGMIWNDGDLPIEDKDIKRKLVRIDANSTITISSKREMPLSSDALFSLMSFIPIIFPSTLNNGCGFPMYII